MRRTGHTRLAFARRLCVCRNCGWFRRVYVWVWEHLCVAFGRDPSWWVRECTWCLEQLSAVTPCGGSVSVHRVWSVFGESGVRWVSGLVYAVRPPPWWSTVKPSRFHPSGEYPRIRGLHDVIDVIAIVFLFGDICTASIAAIAAGVGACTTGPTQITPSTHYFLHTVLSALEL